jgi:phosphoglycerate dehydrogenase-like enzyme
MYVLIADPARSAYRDVAEECLAAEGWDLLMPEGPSDDELAALMPRADVVVSRRRTIPPTLLESPLALRFWQHVGIRVPPDYRMAARRLGVRIAVVPSFGNIMVAEQALALLLATARLIVPGHRDVADGAYRERGLTPRPTSESEIAYWWTGRPGYVPLYGRTLGVVGLGDIGSAVATRAQAFGMRVLYYKRSRLPAAEEATLGVEYRDLDALLPEVDFLSLHLPHTPESDKLIDRPRLALMKPSAILINAARGGLVDEAALVEALRAGQLAGAGLDVFAYEPLPHDSPLCRLENVVLSPHVGSAPAQGLKDLLRHVIPNIRAAMGGGAVAGELIAD